MKMYLGWFNLFGDLRLGLTFEQGLIATAAIIIAMFIILFWLLRSTKEIKNADEDARSG